MNKSKVYTVLWGISLLMPLLVLFFMYTSINLYVVFGSLFYKFSLGIIGVTAAAKDWTRFKDETRNNRKLKLPFFIVTVIIVQIVFLTLLSVVLSGSEAIASGASYAFVIALWVVTFLLGTYAWEVEFLKTIENSYIKVAFAISTPVLMVLAEVIVLLRIMAL